MDDHDNLQGVISLQTKPGEEEEMRTQEGVGRVLGKEGEGDTSEEDGGGKVRKCSRLGIGRIWRLVIADIGRGGQDQSIQGGGHNEGDKGQDCRYGQRSFKAAGECGVQEEVIEEEKCQDNLGG
jgi:hypothetical protein